MDIFRSICGMVDGELACADPALTLGAVSDDGVPLYNIQQTDEVTLRFSVMRKDFRRLKKLAQRRGVTVNVIGRTGIYWNIKTALHRPVLLWGMVLLLLLVFYLPSRVLFIQVEGHEKIPARMILETAENCGISFGASRREVRSERVKNALLHELPELQWAGVNTYGCVAVISVRERSMTEETEEKEGICSIVAALDGIVTSCTATGGNLLCRPGQAVMKGEVLISGYNDCGLVIQADQAEGEVYAQTVRHLTVISPSDYVSKTETAEEKHSFSLIIGKKRINLWKDSGIWDTICDRIYEEYYVTLPGGFQLPLALAVETYAPFRTVDESTERSDIESRLTVFASDYVRQQMVAGEINLQDVAIVQEEGFFCLTGKYICTEMIGKVQWEQIGEYHGENS